MIGIDQLFGLVGFALTAIDSLLHNRATRAAVEVLDDIEKVYGAVRDAQTGHVTPEQAATRIHDLVSRLKANDDKADEDLRRRFADDGGKEP